MEQEIKNLKAEVQELREELDSLRDTLIQYTDHQATKGARDVETV